MSARRATAAERAVAADEAKVRSLWTGEVLKERDLCPLVLVRTRDAGIHVGYLAEYDRANRAVTFYTSWRLWRWRGANSLSEVTVDGIAEESAIARPVQGNEVLGVAEVLQVSTKAAATLTHPRWHT